jgi:hypothetical protein
MDPTSLNRWGYPKYIKEEESEGIHYVGSDGPVIDDEDQRDIFICEATGNPENPYALIKIDKQAIASHEGRLNGADIIPAPPEGCPKTLEVNWCKPCRQGMLVALCFFVCWVQVLGLASLQMQQSSCITDSSCLTCSYFRICFSDTSLLFEDVGRYYCPGGPKRYACDEHATSGANAAGVVDATPCECDYGWKEILGTAKKQCKDIDDWGSWDPITKVPRVGCLDTVSRADCEFFALKCFPDRGSLIADCIPISYDSNS